MKDSKVLAGITVKCQCCRDGGTTNETSKKGLWYCSDCGELWYPSNKAIAKAAAVAQEILIHRAIEAVFDAT